jgi:hypothetical protein
MLFKTRTPIFIIPIKLTTAYVVGTSESKGKDNDVRNVNSRFQMPSGVDSTLRRESTQDVNEEQNMLEGTIVMPKDAKTPEKLPQAEDLCF